MRQLASIYKYIAILWFVVAIKAHPLYGNKVALQQVCTIASIKVANQTTCNATSNYYSQALEITYIEAPSQGKLSVNGQLFDITQSPQTVVLQNLVSDGKDVDVFAVFTEQPTCFLELKKAFKAPASCCGNALDLAPSYSICVGATAQLAVGNGLAAYQWYREGVQLVGQNAATLSTSSVGNYQVITTDASGCHQQASTQVLNLPTATVNFLRDTIYYCAGDNVTLQPTVVGAAGVKWFKNNVQIPNVATSTLTVSEVGTYIIEATAIGLCTTRDTVVVQVATPPVIDLATPTIQCDGTPYIIRAGKNFASYTWYIDEQKVINAASDTLAAVRTGEYKVVVTNAVGCEAEDRVTLNFFASPEITPFADTIHGCQGQSITLTAEIIDFISRQWFYQGNKIQGADKKTFVAMNSGYYEVEATNFSGCKSKEGVYVDIHAAPTIEMDTIYQGCVGSTIILRGGSDGATYQWAENGIPIPNASNFLEVTKTGTYALTVTNTFGCSSMRTSKVTFSNGANISINGDTAICQGSTHVILLSTNAEVLDIAWYKDGARLFGQNSLSYL